MTTVYFVRHAQADNTVRNGAARPLTAKGMQDRLRVTAYLADKGIDAVLSSPYKRAVDTLADFAERYGLQTELVEDFRERRSDSNWDRQNDFWAFLERQWQDFAYTLSDGECLSAVQDRNIAALNDVLTRYEGKTIAIGTHGTALSTMVHYYDPSYGFKDFRAMAHLMPLVVIMRFEGHACQGIEKIDILGNA